MFVVAAALIDPGGTKVLIQRRAERAHHGGLWEFPGGKIEPGEGPEAALVRELHEELGIVVDPAALVPVSFASGGAGNEHDSTGSAITHVILLYTCRSWSGEPAGLDGAATQWVAAAELGAQAMPPLDIPLAAALVRFLTDRTADGILGLP